MLAYLKMCAHSAILDEARRAGPPAVELPSVLEGTEGESEDLSETGVMEQERSQQLWELVSTRLRNEKERVVVHGLFVLDLKPRAIYAQHPDIFHDMKEIYRTRQVVLERLGRDPGLKDFLSDDA